MLATIQYFKDCRFTIIVQFVTFRERVCRAHSLFFLHITVYIQYNKICLRSSNKIHRIVEVLNFTNKFYCKESYFFNHGASSSSSFSVRSLQILSTAEDTNFSTSVVVWLSNVRERLPTNRVKILFSESKYHYLIFTI